MEVLNNLKDFLNAALEKSPPAETPANFRRLENAGGEILAHFQLQWEQMHKTNEENANEASRLADTVAEVHRTIEAANSNLAAINQILANGAIKEAVEGCAKQISDLHRMFEVVEEDLIEFEDQIERCELEKRKLEQKRQLQLYKEQKLNNLEAVRQELNSKHSAKILEFEKKRQKDQQERQQVFQEAFRSDMETFKSLGSIPKIAVKTQPSALLEEIQLDVDDQELNDFLDSQ